MTEGFYDTPTEDLNWIPFDIETTGFKAAGEDFITNIVLHNDDLYHIWINTNERKADASELQKRIIQGAELENIVLYVCEDEKELLENIEDYFNTHADDNTILTAFNGERYNGGFDLPFIRTRCVKNGIGFIFSGFWYTDIMDVIHEDGVFDTTVKGEASLNQMSKSDLEKLTRDLDLDISYGKMGKNRIVNEVNEHESITSENVREWSENNDHVTTTADPSDLNKSSLQEFIDDSLVDIPYYSLSQDDLIRRIQEEGIDRETLVKWHEQTGRSIGRQVAGDLDMIHEVLIEDKMGDSEWHQSLPFEVEVFEPFDPFVSSGEAVTAYKNGKFADVILHCFADVARTVNLNRLMVEYAPKKEYKPKIL